MRRRSLPALCLLAACALGDAPPPPSRGPAAEAAAALGTLAQESTAVQEASARAAGLAAELREGGGRSPEELRPLIAQSIAEARAAHTRAQEALARVEQLTRPYTEAGETP